jgi:hypothetical protein
LLLFMFSNVSVNSGISSEAELPISSIWISF